MRILRHSKIAVTMEIYTEVPDQAASEAHAQPRTDGARETLRILLAARMQATTARTAAVNTLKALLLAAPDSQFVHPRPGSSMSGAAGYELAGFLVYQPSI